MQPCLFVKIILDNLLPFLVANISPFYTFILTSYGLFWYIIVLSMEMCGLHFPYLFHSWLFLCYSQKAVKSLFVLSTIYKLSHWCHLILMKHVHIGLLLLDRCYIRWQAWAWIIYWYSTCVSATYCTNNNRNTPIDKCPATVSLSFLAWYCSLCHLSLSSQALSIST